MSRKRWFLLKIDRRKFNGETVVDVLDSRPRFRVWFLNKWASITARPYLFVTEQREERRKVSKPFYWPIDARR